jgi:hypothetical protein
MIIQNLHICQWLAAINAVVPFYLCKLITRTIDSNPPSHSTRQTKSHQHDHDLYPLHRHVACRKHHETLESLVCSPCGWHMARVNMLEQHANPENMFSSGRRRNKSELTIPKRASAATASLQGWLRANNRRGGEGGKARNPGAHKRKLSITIHETRAVDIGALHVYVSSQPLGMSTCPPNH